MRALMCGAAALFVSTSFAAADDVMANYYGNTLIANSATTDLHIHYKADHTFDAAGTSASGPISFQGKWSIDKRGQLCRDYATPPPGRTNPVCTPWSAHAVGDTWELPGVTLTLVEGVQ